jgi:hypothetical protein
MLYKEIAGRGVDTLAIHGYALLHRVGICGQTDAMNAHLASLSLSIVISVLVLIGDEA